MIRRLALLVVLTAACGSDDEPPLTDATSLSCPMPGALPFRLDSHGFQKSNNAKIAADDPRIKDEAGDILGNPNGPVADVYIADDATPAAGGFRFRGAKQRTTATGGLFSTALSGENVSTWWYDAAGAEWQMLGRGTTDDIGYYEITNPTATPPNLEPVYAMLEADDTCQVHTELLLAPGTKVVITDIDGTLTTDDGQLLMQVTDASYVPAMMGAADKLMQKWAAKHYAIVYLTARPHVFRAETRAWLDSLGFPPGPVITTNSSTPGADAYKTIWLKRLFDTFGWVPVAAYGNADTDIKAYANAGIPGDKTFIVGGLGGGTSGTVEIPNMDYTAHISAFVDAQPDNM